MAVKPRKTAMQWVWRTRSPDMRKQVFMRNGSNREKKKRTIRLLDVGGLLKKCSERLLEAVG